MKTPKNANLTPPRPVRMPASPLHVGVHLADERRQHSAPKDSKEKLFDLVYSCRKESAKGEKMLMTWEECGLVAEPCLDVGTNPDTFEITYQVGISCAVMPHGRERVSGRHVYGLRQFTGSCHHPRIVHMRRNDKIFLLHHCMFRDAKNWLEEVSRSRRGLQDAIRSTNYAIPFSTPSPK